MPLRNINSKWVKDLDIRPETTELLEENIRKKLLITCLGNDFIDMKPKAPKKKRPSEINQWDYIKLKNYCTAKITKATYRKKIFQSMYQIRGSFPKFIKNSYNLITKNPIFKMGTRTKYTFLQRRHLWPKVYETGLSMTNYQRNSNKNHNGISHKASKKWWSSRPTRYKWWRGCGEKGTSYTAGGNVNWCSHYREQYGGSSKKKK